MSYTAQSLRGHRGAVTHLATSSSRAQLLSSSEDSSCRLWDIRTNNHRAVRCLTGFAADAVTCAVFSPIDEYRLYASAGVCVYEFDLRKSDSILLLCAASVMSSADGSEGELNQLSVRSDGSRISCAGDDGMVRVFSTESPDLLEEISSLPVHDSVGTAVRYLPASSHALSGGCDCTVRRLDLEASEILRTLQVGTIAGAAQNVNPPFVHALDVDAEGLLAAVGVGNGNVLLLDPSSEDVLATLSAHQSAVASVVWRPGTSYLWTGGGEDRCIFLWDAALALAVDGNDDGDGDGDGDAVTAEMLSHLKDSGHQQSKASEADVASEEAADEDNQIPLLHISHPHRINSLAVAADLPGSVFVADESDVIALYLLRQ
eukprot:NODE_2415_length_1205_cov_46.040657_g2202_i0.p1 GENE.NODE_2415_length_1205_cov_46.040657_g2202_i0~~NODE_2415_length_1205_cov_46.040657_g2202_i0.p1  ORF type:complete len:374 (+),score=68.60 NODE_2415_length_1205_cov_46.040657_g2202_i0:62-1183(+)